MAKAGEVNSDAAVVVSSLLLDDIPHGVRHPFAAGAKCPTSHDTVKTSALVDGVGRRTE